MPSPPTPCSQLKCVMPLTRGSVLVAPHAGRQVLLADVLPRVVFVCVTCRLPLASWSSGSPRWSSSTACTYQNQWLKKRAFINGRPPSLLLASGTPQRWNVRHALLDLGFALCPPAVGRLRKPVPRFILATAVAVVRFPQVRSAPVHKTASRGLSFPANWCSSRVFLVADLPSCFWKICIRVQDL